MTEETKQLDLLPSPSKEDLKESVARIAADWPPYDKRYSEEAFFADIDNGKLTTEKEISDVFMSARALWL